MFYVQVRLITAKQAYLNGLKGIFPPIVLDLIWRLDQCKDHEEQKMLLQRLDHVYLIRRQLPLRKKGRFAVGWDGAQVDAFRQQCTTGIASRAAVSKIPTKKLWIFAKMSGRFARTRTNAPYDTPRQDDVDSFIRDFEHRPGARPLRRINNVPYPVSSLTLPTMPDQNGTNVR